MMNQSEQAANDDRLLRAGCPDRNNQPETYTIAEMAKEFDVTLRALRFYEDKGLLSPRRQSTQRLYSRRDRARLKLILFGRKVGFSLRDVKKILDLYDPGSLNIRQLKVFLDKSERQLEKLQAQRDALDEAYQVLEGHIDAVRGELDQVTAMRACS